MIAVACGPKPPAGRNIAAIRKAFCQTQPCGLTAVNSSNSAQLIDLVRLVIRYAGPDQTAAAQLASDGHIEQCQITDILRDRWSGTDLPDLFGSNERF